MKIIKYGILRHGSPEKLSEDVNKAIEQGWVPNGPVSIATGSYGSPEEGHSYSTVYAQSMVLYAEEVK